MNKQQLGRLLSEARAVCARSGGQLTAKRERLLALLLCSPAPLSAYELADAYNEVGPAKIPVMSVYRMLAFLKSRQLVHKLECVNKYVVCAHIDCGRDHGVPQFLICRCCQKVREIAAADRLFEQLDQQAAEAGYQLTRSQLELPCLCNTCQTDAA